MEQHFSSNRRSLDGVKTRPTSSRPAAADEFETVIPTQLLPEARKFRRLRLKPKKSFRSRSRNFFSALVPRTPKKAALYIGCLTLLVGVALGTKLILTSCKVFICRDSNNSGALALQENVDPTKLRGEGDGRVNILLIGIGGVRHQAGDLSDTIMIVSLDPISKDVAMLSVPRDLYVQIPGYGSERINAAYAYGERYNYPGGGPALLKETLSQILGIPIHYYVRADFDGFKEAVAALGGVDVNVDKAIYDNSYPKGETGGYEVFQISAGHHYLDAETALKYARSRHSSSDFDRGSRQQKLLLAIKDKALSIGTLTNPVKINSLLGAIGGHVRTDFRLDEIKKLIDISRDVHNDQITRAVLDNSPNNYLASANIGGAAVLIPKAGMGNYTAIKAYVRKLFVDGFIKNEAATVQVLNGTTHPGLGGSTAALLKSYGYKVTMVGDDAETNHQTTVIYDYTNGAKPYTIRYLERRFGVTSERRNPPSGQHADITIIVGNDYKPQS